MELFIVSEQITTAPPVQSKARHLDFLDGIRGLAALYVTLFHVAAARKLLTGWPALALCALDYGHYAVSVFIVLSGFSLMLPVAGSADGRLRGGFGDYIKRRARRILPPYYAALGLALFLIVINRLILHTSESAPGQMSPFDPGNLLSHLLLFHNLRREWADSINGVLWTVGTEWDIYFVFPLLLLPVWRRWGIGAALVAGFAFGYLCHRALALTGTLSLDYYWYVGLFAMGMAGATIYQRTKGAEADARLARRGREIFAGCAAVFLLLAAFAHPFSLSFSAPMDTLIGLGTTALLVACAACRAAAPESGLGAFQFLEYGPVVRLGTFSYSLYLTHYVFLI